MKALSIQQPWAWLIVNGYKPIENRNWPSHHIGPTLIHAGKKHDHAGEAWIRRNFPEIQLPSESQLEHGGIVGRADLIRCTTHDDSRWFFGPYGFVLADATPLPFRAVRGQLGFFEVAE